MTAVAARDIGAPRPDPFDPTPLVAVAKVTTWRRKS